MTATQSGITNAQGNFSFKAGEVVSFYVGDILIGQAIAKSTMTPLDLVPNASSQTDPQVTNILRFLQSLDSNNDPSDGITIIAEAQAINFSATINFNQSIASFELDQAVLDYFSAVNQAASSSLALISATAAQQHFYLTVVSSFNGSYSGSFSGDVTGTWSFSVSDGAVSGSITSNGLSFDVTGQLNIDGSVDIVVANSGIQFSATFTIDGIVSGTWADSVNNTSGSFTNQLASETPYIPPSQTGSLTLSGADVANFNTSVFTPEYSYSQNPDRPTWQQAVGDRTYSIFVDVNSDGTVRAAQFNNLDTNGDITTKPYYIYKLDCILNNPVCSALVDNISVDLQAQTVTFNNLSLPAFIGNDATSDLVVNGTLSYMTALVFN